MNVGAAPNHNHNTHPPRGRRDEPSEEARAVAVAVANGNAAIAPGATGGLKRGDPEEEPAAVKKVGAAAFADEAATPKTTTTTTTTASEASAAPALLRRVSSFDSAGGGGSGGGGGGGGGGDAHGSASPPRREEEAGPRATARTTAPNPPPGPNDVLCGRGNGANLNEGNVRFRALVGSRKALYDAAGKLHKVHVVRGVVADWRDQSPPGRFLQFDKVTKKWSEASPMVVEKKAAQAFRDKNKPGAGAGDDFEPYPLRPDANDREGSDLFDPEEAAVLDHIFSGDTEASEEPGNGEVFTRPDALNDCVLGAQGQSTAIQGTRRFWEWVSQGTEQYLATSFPQQDLMAQQIVLKWGACGGRFLRHVTILKRCSWVVAEDSDAVAMVHLFLGGDWVITPSIDSDFLQGRGGETNTHAACERFRATMDTYRLTYLRLHPSERRALAAVVVAEWRAQVPSGRFLRRHATLGLWGEIDVEDAVTMAQKYMGRNRDSYLDPHHHQQEQQLPPALVGSASSAHPAYMSARFSGGLLSSIRTSSSSSPPPSSSRPPKKGRIAALAGRVGRLLAPLLCMFGRGRDGQNKQGP